MCGCECVRACVRVRYAGVCVRTSSEFAMVRSAVRDVWWQLEYTVPLRLAIPADEAGR